MFTRRAVFRIRADSPAEFTRIVEGRFLPPPHAREGAVTKNIFITPKFSAAVINLRQPSN